MFETTNGVLGLRFMWLKSIYKVPHEELEMTTWNKAVIFQMYMYMDA